MTDQQRFDAIRRVQDELAWYENVTKIQTPHLDELSRQGVYFRNAYTQCAVCGPARASLRTGCTIERTGVQHNDMATTAVKKAVFSSTTDDEYPQNDDEEQTMTDFFHKRIESLRGLDEVLASEGGYRNEYYGKFHLPSNLWEGISFNDYDYREDEFGFHGDTLKVKVKHFLQHHEREGNIPKDVSDTKEANKRFQMELGSHWQVDNWSLRPYRPLAVDARCQAPPNTPLTTENGFKLYQIGQSNVCGEFSLGAEYTTTAMIGDASLRALRRLLEPVTSAGNQTTDMPKTSPPFSLTVSFHNPHPPMIAAPNYLDYYMKRKDTLFVPPSVKDDLTNTDYQHIDFFEAKLRDPALVQEWTAVYYAMIQEIDDWVGRIWATINENGAKENTIIIFTSDHGEMLGAHGMREKNVFFEESSHVPLFVVFPHRIPAGLTINATVSHLDVFSTLLDYAGLSDVDDSDGTSLRKFIEKTSFNSRFDEDVVVGEWDYRRPLPTNPRAGDRPMDDRPAFLVRKGPYKLMMHKDANSTKMDMMYNLDKDPFETNNLLGSNAGKASLEVLGKAEHLRCLLLDWIQRMDNDTGLYTTPEPNFGEGRGDWEEVRQRQFWPALDIWISDTEVVIDQPVLIDGALVRNEYLYFGSRSNLNGALFDTLSVVGKHAMHFRVDSDDKSIIEHRGCQRLKVSVAFPEEVYLRLAEEPLDAQIKIQWAGSADPSTVKLKLSEYY